MRARGGEQPHFELDGSLDLLREGEPVSSAAVETERVPLVASRLELRER